MYGDESVENGRYVHNRYAKDSRVQRIGTRKVGDDWEMKRGAAGRVAR